MPVTVKALCRACVGYGQTWEPDGRWLDCVPCKGAGHVLVRVRTVYDTLADSLVHYGIGTMAIPNADQDAKTAANEYADPCLYANLDSDGHYRVCLAHTHPHEDIKAGGGPAGPLAGEGRDA